MLMPLLLLLVLLMLLLMLLMPPLVLELVLCSRGNSKKQKLFQAIFDSCWDSA